MLKLSLVGLASQKEQVLSFLQKQGVAEISDMSNLLQNDDWKELAGIEDNSKEVQAHEASISETRKAISLLNIYAPVKTGFFPKKREVVSFTEEDKTKAFEAVSKLLENEGKLLSLKSLENSLTNKILSLKPWESYTLPLGFTKTKSSKVLIGTVLDNEEKVKEATESGGGILEVIYGDSTQSFVSIICHESDAENILENIKPFGFSSVTFTGENKTALEIIKVSEAEIENAKIQRDEIIEKIKSMSSEREYIENLFDILSMELDKKKIKSRILQTQSTFYLTAWLPEDTGKPLEDYLNKKFTCSVEIRHPHDDEDFPILLKNNKFVEPFEVVTEQYSLPKPRGFDPNAIMAPFYAMFFGLMLSDAAYGVVLAVACAFVLKKFKPEGMAKKMFGLLFWGGISTIFWGAMFGSWFGDLLKNYLGLTWVKPIMYDPVERPMDLLVLSFILGGIHLLAGLGVQAYILIRSGKFWDAVFDVFSWCFILVGVGLFFMGGSAKEIGIVVALLGAGIILLTGGRAGESIFKKITGGLGSLYNITGYLSDVLSYSRLLALGLATGVIASVINQMGSMGGPLVLFVACLIGHPFNLGINALGAYVHACRLQYVEFFGKFYEGGGKAFKPFNINTKYVNFKEEM